MNPEISSPRCNTPSKVMFGNRWDERRLLIPARSFLIHVRSLLIHVRNPLFRIPLLTHQALNKNLKLWRPDVKTWYTYVTVQGLNALDVKTYCPDAGTCSASWYKEPNKKSETWCLDVGICYPDVGIWCTLRRLDVRIWSSFVIGSPDKNRGLMLWCKDSKSIKCPMRKDWMPYAKGLNILCEGIEYPMRRNLIRYFIIVFKKMRCLYWKDDWFSTSFC